MRATETLVQSGRAFNLNLSTGTHPDVRCPRFESCRAKGKPMQVPSIQKGERPFDLLKGGIAGAILITAVGFNWAGYGFGWTLRSTAEQKAKDAEEAAIVRVLAPICADKFRQASDSVAKLAALKGTDSWKRDDFIKDTGYATFPGSEYDRKVAETCVELLTQVK